LKKNQKKKKSWRIKRNQTSLGLLIKQKPMKCFNDLLYFPSNLGDTRWGIKWSAFIGLRLINGGSPVAIS